MRLLAWHLNGLQNERTRCLVTSSKGHVLKDHSDHPDDVNEIKSKAGEFFLPFLIVLRRMRKLEIFETLFIFD